MDPTISDTKTSKETQTSKPTPFLDLPGEIRNEIYRMCLISEIPIETNMQMRSEPTIHIRLLHVSQQIRTETKAIFWSENSFQFSAVGFHANPRHHWLQKVGRDCSRLITNMTLKLAEDGEPPLGKRFFRHHRNSCFMALRGTQMHDEVKQLLACGLTPSSIKISSKFIARPSVTDLEKSGAAFDNYVLKRFTLQSVRDYIPHLRRTQSGDKCLTFNNISHPVQVMQDSEMHVNVV